MIQIDTGPTCSTLGRYKDIQLVDGTGWLVGSTAWVLCGGDWIPTSCELPFEVGWRVLAVDKATCWVACEDQVDDAAWLVRTQDGGHTWFEETVSPAGSRPTIAAITRSPNGVGWIVGQLHGDGRSVGKLWQSLGPGKPWRESPFPEDLDPQAIAFESSKRGWILCLSKRQNPARITHETMSSGWYGEAIRLGGRTTILLETSDGGRTWDEVFTYDGEMYAMTVAGACTLVLAGEHGTVIKFLDRKARPAVRRIDGAHDININCIDAASSTILVAGDQGLLGVSTDLGASWTTKELASAGADRNLDRVALSDAKSGMLIVGEEAVLRFSLEV